MISYYSKFIYSFLSIFILLIPEQAFSQREYIQKDATIEQATQMSTVEYWEKDIKENTDKDGVFEFNILHYPRMSMASKIDPPRPSC